MRVVLIGGGGHASDVLAAFEEAYRSDPSGHPVMGYLDDAGEKACEKRFRGRLVGWLGSLDAAESIEATHFVLALGWPARREQILERLAGSRLQPIGIVDPRSSVHFTAQLGIGTVVMAHAHVSANVVLGPHTCISAGAIIGHDTSVGAFASVMPGAVVSGDVTLEPGCTIGTNATVIEGLRVGARAMLGAGAVAIRDVPPHCTAVGVPAK